MAGPLAEVENAVKRPHWEPRHEWESRVKFVEDNLADYGLEKAISLSIVWANMKFLGCSYPPGTERQVNSYPLPPLEELKARRKAKQSLKRGLSGEESAVTPKRTKLDDTILDVSSLISSIRSQSENQQSSGVFVLEYDETLSKNVPQSIQVVANKVCLCKDCIGCDGVNEKATRLLQKYANSEDSSFRFEFNEETVPQAFAPADGYKCTLFINGDSVIEKLVACNKDSKSYVSAALLKMADDWQEARGKPACPNLTQPADSQQQQQRTAEYHGTYNNTPSRSTYDRGRGSTYNRGRGNTYNRGHGNTYDQGLGNTYDHRWGDHHSRQSPSQDRSRFNNSQDYFMPPPQSARRSGRGYGGHGNSGGGYQYGSPRYY